MKGIRSLRHCVSARLIAAAGFLCVFANGSGAQNGLAAQSATIAPTNYARVPFGVGEKMTYKVTLGIVGEVGKGSLEVVNMDTVQGRASYQLRFQVQGGIPFAR